MILYINACVRTESRTHRLAKCLLAKLGDYEELKLTEMGFDPLDEETLAERTNLIAAGDYSDPMFQLAKQFAAADEIVISAPYWDMSFPAILKIYLENVYITGIVSSYGPDGRPKGLCKAKKLYYVTTAGGPYDPTYSYEYLRNMSMTCFGIPETELIKAEMLDVIGYDAEQILRECEANI